MILGVVLIIIGAFIVTSRLDAFMAYAKKLLDDQEDDKTNLIVLPKPAKKAVAGVPAVTTQSLEVEAATPQPPEVEVLPPEAEEEVDEKMTGRRGV